MLDTLEPYDPALPPPSEATKRAIQAFDDPSAVRLVSAPLTAGRAIAVGVPVARDGNAAWMLLMVLPPDTMAKVWERSHLPADWSALDLDRDGATVAQYPATAKDFENDDRLSLLDQISKAGEHEFYGDIKGIGSILVIHATSTVSHWTFIVGVPQSVVDAPVRHASIFIAGGATLMILCMGFAVFVGTRLDAPYRRRIAASEEQLRVMAETVPGILFANDPEGRCDYVNQRFCDYTGMTADAAHGHGWMAALHREDKARVLRGLVQPLAEDDVLLSELRLRGKDGSYRWFLGRSRPVRDTRGRIIKWIGSAADVDDLKRAEAALRDVNQRLSAVLSSIDECYYTVDHDFRITYVNPGAAAFFGDLPDHLVGRSLWEVVRGRVDDDVAKRFRNVIVDHAPLHMDYESSYKPGLWLEVHCYPWADGMSVFFRDVSRRKSTEDALRRAQELGQRTMDALSAHIAILDESGVIIGVNQAWRRFLAEMVLPEPNYGIGSNYLAILNLVARGSSDAEQATRGLQAVIRSEIPELRMHFSVTTPERSMCFQLRAVRFGDDGARRIVISHVDITELKQAEADLQDLAGRLLEVQDAERRRLASELHDTTAQNLVAAALDLGRVQRVVPDIGDAARAILDETRALIDQSLQEIRTFSYLLHPPLLEELGLVSALRWFVRGFEERSGISTSLSLQENFVRLPLTAERALFRVVQEALTNIHRHSGSPTAEIVLTQSAAETVLEVSDRGKGIGDIRLSDEFRDVGVGISGMRVRLRQLGGNLEIRARGDGTTVKARVPFEAGRDRGHRPTASRKVV